MTTEEIDELAIHLASLWSIPALASASTIEFSSRMTVSLGRCIPTRGIVRLNASLQADTDELLHEVVCHELAHMAVYLRHGAGVRPHGPEWRGLVEAAGYTPSVRLSVDASLSSGARPRVTRWEHRCAVCHTVRIARTATPRWRCAECVADGLVGQMIVTRHRSSTPRSVS
jgi:predicted SprT family Zn-dependent metalloprotease